MYLKIHENSDRRIVAVCDKELLGRVLEEGNVYIDLDKYRSFYAGELAGEEEVKKSLGDFHSANLVGKKAVHVGIEMGLVNEDDIIYVNKVPHTQIYKI